MINSIFVTGMVIIMMMMIESLNIESSGRIFNRLKQSRLGQVTTGALLGLLPGCVGGFATVSLYTHGMLSFGALVAMMIASSGDEAFVMLAMIPQKALLIFGILLVIAIAAGWLTDLFGARKGTECKRGVCTDGYRIHPDDECPRDGQSSDKDCGTKGNGNGHGCEKHGKGGHHHHESSRHPKERHLSWKRVLMAVCTAAFAAALGFGLLEHEHAEEACASSLSILDEKWMNILFALLSCIILVLMFTGSDHFIEEHLWRHVIVKHLGGIFAWTFGVLLLINVGLHYFDIGNWVSDNTALMILLAVLVGIIPESGPHLIFVTLYANGLVSLPVLLASCISQDGHSSLPLLAEDRRGFLKAKAINCVIALLVGYSAWLLL
ncbi:MAG: putative manganese transporter [Candidatus Cryptobacteroides sp.]